MCFLLSLSNAIIPPVIVFESSISPPYKTRWSSKLGSIAGFSTTVCRGNRLELAVIPVSSSHNTTAGEGMDLFPGSVCDRVQLLSQHQGKGPSFNPAHPQCVLAIQACSIQMSIRHKVVQLERNTSIRSQTASCSSGEQRKAVESMPDPSFLGLILVAKELRCSRGAYPFAQNLSTLNSFK